MSARLQSQRWRPSQSNELVRSSPDGVVDASPGNVLAHTRRAADALPVADVVRVLLAVPGVVAHGHAGPETPHTTSPWTSAGPSRGGLARRSVPCPCAD